MSKATVPLEDVIAILPRERQDRIRKRAAELIAAEATVKLDAISNSRG